MNNILLDLLHIENFKGIRNLDVNFKEKTEIKGQNASGKTSVFDAFTWLLFDKDSSGANKFELRPLDENGDKIHHIEISVAANIVADGDEIELKKTQKENWVKKRGAEEAEYQGNKNFYEINGFPKSEREFKEFISEMIDEDLFKLLTNPMTFSAMKWQDQRAILMRFVDDVPTEEVAQSVENFDLIASDVAQASVDDCKKKYSKATKELKDRQKEIPVRIDELSGQKVTIDADALNKKREELVKQIDEMESKEFAITSIGTLNQRIAELEKRERQLSDDANADRKSRLNALNVKIRDAETERDSRRDALEAAKRDVARYLAEYKTAKEDYEDLKSKFESVKAKEFDESSNICSACGQALPEDKQEENRKRFMEWQDGEKAKINAEAKETIQRAKTAQSKAEEADERMKILNKEVIAMTEKVKELESQRAPLEQPIDVSGSDEQKKITKEILETRHQIAQYDKLEVEKQAHQAKIVELKDELRVVDAEIASASINESLDKRIAELKSELKETGQKLSDSERLLYVLENYVRFISQKINERFDGLEFKLFETQINSGIRECCEVTYQGVPYGSLNSGHRIVVGLEIIKTLQELYETKAPVWCDNAETINSYNVPDMDCQMVMLRVTDDKELVVA